MTIYILSYAMRQTASTNLSLSANYIMRHGFLLIWFADYLHFRKCQELSVQDCEVVGRF